MAPVVSRLPYVAHQLKKLIDKLNANKEKKVIKTMSRASMIIPEMIGHRIAVHNGRTYFPIHIKEAMVGHKLGEFSFTRARKPHKTTTTKKPAKKK